MRTLKYALKGKEVATALIGAVVAIRQAESVQDGVASGIFKDESALVEKANDGYTIALQGLLRNKAAGKKQEDGTLKIPTVAELQAFADGYTYAVRGEGTQREVKPETKAARAAKSTGNKLFEKCLSDEKERARMVRLGVLDEDEFNEWVAARQTPATQPQA